MDCGLNNQSIFEHALSITPDVCSDKRNLSVLLWNKNQEQFGLWFESY